MTAAAEHTTAILAALLHDAKRARASIGATPITTAMFRGDLSVALTVAWAMPTEALDLRGLSAKLTEGGRPDLAERLADEIITRGTTTPEAAGHHARELVRLHAGELRRDAGERMAKNPSDGRARELLAEADTLDAACNGTKAGPQLATVSASDLFDLDLPAPVWFVPGLITQGCTLLCSKPKVGKSWMALQLAVAVASGGIFLSKYRCPKHDALYLALEDTPRRLKDRLARMLHGQRPPKGLHLVTDAPRMPQGLELLQRELDAAPGVRLVIVDTLQRFRPPSAFRSGAYEGDYDALVPLKRLADTRELALLVVHHVRKADADDVFDTVSGTNGLTGAVDSTLVLKRNRAERDGTLHGTGRDLEDVELPLRFAPDGNWSAVEGAAALPDAQAEVARVLQEAGRPLPIRDVADRIGKQYDTTKKLLERMREAGRAAKERGGYVYTHSLPSLMSHVPSVPNVPDSGQRDIGDIGTYPHNVEVDL